MAAPRRDGPGPHGADAELASARATATPAGASAARNRTAAARSLGVRGEEAAAAWYAAAGYTVLARNWRCRDGEIDVIVRRGSTVVFCEVKTRSSAAFGVPAEAVTFTKQARLRRLAARWLREVRPRPAPSELRFDVAAVMGDRVEILEAAF